jgi:HEAT repeat protein
MNKPKRIYVVTQQAIIVAAIYFSIVLCICFICAFNVNASEKFNLTDAEKSKDPVALARGINNENWQSTQSRLSEMGESIIKPLNKIFDELNSMQQRVIINAFGAVGSDEAVKCLMKRYQDFELKQFTINALVEAKEKSTEPLFKWLSDDDPGKRSFAVAVLSRIGGEKIEDAIIGRFHIEREETVKMAILYNMSLIKDNRVIDILINEAINGKEFEARCAFNSLYERKDGKCISAMEKIIEDENCPIWKKVEAASVLVELGRKEFISEFIKGAHDPDASVRLDSAVYLGRTRDPEYEDLLINMLNDSKTEVRFHVIYALEEIGTKRAKRAVADLCNDPDENVRQAAEMFSSSSDIEGLEKEEQKEEEK